jgi:hypothetical protein
LLKHHKPTKPTHNGTGNRHWLNRKIQLPYDHAHDLSNLHKLRLNYLKKYISMNKLYLILFVNRILFLTLQIIVCFIER